MRNLLKPRRSAVYAALLCAACQAAPPTYQVASEADLVRADSPFLATQVAQMLERNRARVLDLVPGSKSARLEIWLQDELRLYRFRRSSYEDADGFWAEEAGRIHLRTKARFLERTLVHELVHSALDESWSALPGTLEEGLCDWVSTRICPHSAAQLRAGRLSAAMRAAYVRLHGLGYAHCLAVHEDGELAGGIYGVQLGGVFYGESMFSTRTDGSKSALAALWALAPRLGIGLLDAQVENPHLMRLGASLMPRADFQRRLDELITDTTPLPWPGGPYRWSALDQVH